MDWKQPFTELEIGKGQQLTKGTDIAILSLGPIGHQVSRAMSLLEKDHISAAHFDMRFLKPLDHDLLRQVFTRFDKIITVEDASIAGGLGSAVLEFMSDRGYKADVMRLGIPDRFVDHGTQEELYHECGYDAEGIATTVRSMVLKKVLSKVI